MSGEHQVNLNLSLTLVDVKLVFGSRQVERYLIATSETIIVSFDPIKV